MFDDPNYTKPSSGEAIGKGLSALVGGYQGQKQLQNQTKAVQFQDPNRPINNRDLLGLLLEDYKQHNLNQQLQTMINPTAPTTPYNPGLLLQQLQRILTPQQAAASSGPPMAGGAPGAPMPNIQMPSPSGGGNPQFLPQQQLQAQNQGQTPATVSRSGFQIQALVDELRKRGSVK